MADDQGTALTLNQVVAANIAFYRQKAGLTQRELGKKLDWSNVSVSEAERSRDGRRPREFDAATLGALAIVLGIPVVALFLPPPGEDGRFAAGTEVLNAAGMLGRIVMPDNDDETPVMDAYRQRFNHLALEYARTDPNQARLIARWTDRGSRRVGLAARYRSRAAAQRETAADLDAIAAEIEKGQGQ